MPTTVYLDLCLLEFLVAEGCLQYENCKMETSLDSSSLSSSAGASKESIEDVNNVDIHDDIVVRSQENGSVSRNDTRSVSDNDGSITRSGSDKSLRRQKSLLLNTKSYLMNSLLHFDDRNKITAQLTKQKTVGRKSRNYCHGRIYNYVLPAPEQIRSQVIIGLLMAFAFI